MFVKKLAKQGSLEILCDDKAAEGMTQFEQFNCKKIFLRQWGINEY